MYKRQKLAWIAKADIRPPDHLLPVFVILRHLKWINIVLYWLTEANPIQVSVLIPRPVWDISGEIVGQIWLLLCIQPLLFCLGLLFNSREIYQYKDMPEDLRIASHIGHETSHRGPTSIDVMEPYPPLVLQGPLGGSLDWCGLLCPLLDNNRGCLLYTSPSPRD